MKNLVNIVCEVYINDCDIEPRLIDEDNVLVVNLILGDQKNDGIKHLGWDWGEVKGRMYGL